MFDFVTACRLSREKENSKGIIYDICIGDSELLFDIFQYENYVRKSGCYIFRADRYISSPVLNEFSFPLHPGYKVNTYLS